MTNADLAGENHEPPVATDATGRAIFEITSLDGRSLHYVLTVANIENVTHAHLHIGGLTVNGPVVALLFDTSVSVSVINEQILGEGIIQAGDLVGPFEGMDLSTLVVEMRAGNTYVNIHTVQNPAGEIRGQIETVANALFQEPLIVNGREFTPVNRDGDGLYEDLNGD